MRLLPTLVLLILVLAVGAGCDRPFVEESPPSITILSPNLSTVVTEPVVVVEVQVDSELRGIDTVRVNGRSAAFDPETQTYRLDFAFARGVNALQIEAEDAGGNVSRATRFGVFLPAAFALETAGPAFVLMPEALGGHAAVRLDDGRVLVTGGTPQRDGTVRDIAYVFNPQSNRFKTLSARMVEARAGHTASLLPDGRVLLLGGVRQSPAGGFGDFVTDGELFDPRTETFTRVTLSERSPAMIRADHAAHVVTVDGGTFVYVIGGRGRIASSGTAVGTRSDFRILELVPPNDGFGAGPTLDSSLSVGPALARTPTAVSAFTFTALGAQDEEGFGDFLLAGTYVPPNDIAVDSVALAVTLGLNPSYDDVPVRPMTTARIGHAGDAIEPGLVLVAGGQVRGTGAPVPEAEVYAAEARRFFAFPLASGAPRLNVGRSDHTATKLADGRILFLGGFDRNGAGIALAEFFTTL
ncbi:MAG: kelch repeat-containing protein [Bacteroidota bacterium]